MRWLVGKDVVHQEKVERNFLVQTVIIDILLIKITHLILQLIVWLLCKNEILHRWNLMNALVDKDVWNLESSVKLVNVEKTLEL